MVRFTSLVAYTSVALASAVGCRTAPPNRCPLAPAPQRRLAVGQTARSWIDPQNERTRTRIVLERYASYALRGQGKWLDDGLDSTTARGYPATEHFFLAVPWFLVVQLATRHPRAPLYSLVGELSSRPRAFLRIGDSLPTFRPDATGELVVFANDAKHFYGNNRGCMQLLVERLQ